MEMREQLALLAQDMRFEPDSPQEVDCRPILKGKPVDIPVSEVQLPGGKRMKVLKTLLTSACERNCYYCPFRAGRDMRRATFVPDDMAAVFIQMQQARLVEGLFLSSGIAGGGMRTQDRILDTAEILRRKYHYRGYIHLKIMPGAEKDQVRRAMELASRLSVNLEAPNSERLHRLAPKKHFTEELVEPLLWIEEIRREQPAFTSWNGRWPSTATQFVVGAVGESDLELLATSEKLYRQAHLQRAYYSGFNPVENTPLENVPAEDPMRQHRLYQSSFLLRDYGFSIEEMPFNPDGNLPRSTDPKLAWAGIHLAGQPIELNTAGLRELMRIPGIGPKTARLIERSRRLNKFRSLSDLQKLGVKTGRMAAFVLLDGKRPAYQMDLF